MVKIVHKIPGDGAGIGGIANGSGGGVVQITTIGPTTHCRGAVLTTTGISSPPPTTGPGAGRVGTTTGGGGGGGGGGAVITTT